VANGDIFCRSVRDDNFVATGDFGYIARSDYGIPFDYCQNYNSETETIPGYGDVFGGIPGMWPKIGVNSAHSIDTPDQIAIGLPIDATVNWYGIALFVFDNGLPTDFKQALRWMRTQWLAGNKVIWPGWVTVL